MCPPPPTPPSENPESAPVTITFFKKFLAAEVAHNETSLWTVTFTPVCSGPRKELKSPVQKQLIVTGKPKVGDHVCKGPHWNYALSGKEGVVVANETQGRPLTIEWGGKQYCVHWGDKTPSTHNVHFTQYIVFWSAYQRGRSIQETEQFQLFCNVLATLIHVSK